MTRRSLRQLYDAQLLPRAGRALGAPPRKLVTSCPAVRGGLAGPRPANHNLPPSLRKKEGRRDGARRTRGWEVEWRGLVAGGAAADSKTPQVPIDLNVFFSSLFNRLATVCKRPRQKLFSATRFWFLGSLELHRCFPF